MACSVLTPCDDGPDDHLMVHLPGLRLKVVAWWRRELVEQEDGLMEFFYDVDGNCDGVDFLTGDESKEAQ